MCCSDMLHIFRYRLVAAARMLTVRLSADTRTNTARGRYLGPPRGRSPRKIYVAAARMLTGRSSADTRLTQHAERILDHLAGEARAGFIDGRNARGRPNGTPYPKPTTKVCTTLFADRNQRLEIVSPICCTQSSTVPNVQPRTQVISPGPVANGLTQCRPPAEAPPATPAAAYASHASRSSLQQKHTAAEESSPPWKECVCAHDDRVDHRNEPRVTLKLRLKPTGS